MFVVAAEFMGASEGLGFLLVDGQQLGKPAQIVAAIVAFAVIGKITDWLIVGIAAPFLRWEDRFKSDGGRINAMLTLERVGKTYANGVHALEGVNFSVGPGEIVAIVGGSGCGKSTLLRAISGLDTPSQGRVMLDGEPVTQPHEKIGIIFQEPRLLPWLTVAGNVGFGLEDRPRAERDARVAETLSRVGLSEKARCGRANCRAGRRSASQLRAHWCRARSAAARRAVLRARCLHPRRFAGPSARPVGRHAADADSGHARRRRGGRAGRSHHGDAAAAGPDLR